MSPVYKSLSALVTSTNIESRPRLVSLGPWLLPMASRTSSMLVNDDPDGEVNLPGAEHEYSGCRRT